MDNIFMERLWRSLKYEEVYLKAYETGSDARAGIRAWIEAYNARRPHQALDYAQRNLPTAPNHTAAELKTLKDLSAKTGPPHVK